MKYLAFTFLFFMTLNSQTKLLSDDLVQEQKTIIVYGSDTCHYCTDTKAFLKEKKVKFIYFDVDVNLEKQQEMLNKLIKANIDVSSLSLPVIDKGGEIFTNGKDFKAFLKRIIK
ncbi:glutaredoxin family protein [Mariniflexile sp. AS56]|uniref:glutaredoxin family protein n=1 Tax=Mariniflexile sp. AS56 TaxID=3063957 RepID=UPI0026F0016D|nr:glutaredoxin family protein [Mariniflexile sp. AS56]MDO7172046.1 glutaredoxin family protein [Mariniflexile sp. AS56]